MANVYMYVDANKKTRMIAISFCFIIVLCAAVHLCIKVVGLDVIWGYLEEQFCFNFPYLSKGKLVFLIVRNFIHIHMSIHMFICLYLLSQKV